jgi:hypothetical protein
MEEMMMMMMIFIYVRRRAGLPALLEPPEGYGDVLS